MWFYKFKVNFFDGVSDVILEGITVGDTLNSAIENITNYCGEGNISNIRISLLNDKGLLSSDEGILGLKIENKEVSTGRKECEAREITDLLFKED